MLPIYGALHFVPAVLFKRKAFAEDPGKVLVRAGMGSLRSSAFLGVFVVIYQSLSSSPPLLEQTFIHFHATSNILLQTQTPQTPHPPPYRRSPLQHPHSPTRPLPTMAHRRPHLQGVFLAPWVRSWFVVVRRREKEEGRVGDVRAPERAGEHLGYGTWEGVGV